VAVIEDGRVAEEFALDDASTPRVTALGRELAFHSAEAAAAPHQGVLHA
jgi:D-methionine transport system ATP-binding protein